MQRITGRERKGVLVRAQYRIEGQYFDERFEMGVLIEIKEVATGKSFHKSPIEIFKDLKLLEKLSPEDVRMIGYIVGDYQMHLSQKLIRSSPDWPKTKN